MATSPSKNDLQLVTEAVGAHGIFFKKALRIVLEKISGLRILAEEYPVRYLEGASIDLLVEFRAAGATFVLPIECKRALVSKKRWIFFRDVERQIKFLYSLDGPDLGVGQSSRIRLTSDICIEGVELDLTKLRGGAKSPYSAASVDRIWEAAFQVCKGGLGFLQAELKARTTPPTTPSNFHVFLLVVTTAPLQIAELPEGSVDLGSGTHIGELAVTDVPWLILHYPFTPSSSLGTRFLQVNVPGYVDPVQRGLHSKEGIMIVNAEHVVRFFELLRQEPSS